MFEQLDEQCMACHDFGYPVLDCGNWDCERYVEWKQKSKKEEHNGHKDNCTDDCSKRS